MDDSASGVDWDAGAIAFKLPSDKEATLTAAHTA